MNFSCYLLSVCLLAPSAVLHAQTDEIRLNQIQVLGTHNSYKLPIDSALMKILGDSSDRMRALDYSHEPYSAQLDAGMRSLEIDVVYDPKGGLYADPWGARFLKSRNLSAAPYDPQGEMKKPGFKVLHVPDIDFRSHTYTFRESLRQLKAWSDAHPNHLPIIITMNAKADGIKNFNTLLKLEGSEASNAKLVEPLQFDAAAFDAWDAEIRGILPANKLIIPDDVRGSYETLEKAVLAHAWPRLSQMKGRFLFMLDEHDEKMETYIKGHPSLKGRVMFVNAKEGRPEAAFRIVNEPVEKMSYIQYLVLSGYLVRTRADANTVEARKGDYSRWQAALESGAHVISTDYYRPDESLKTGYHVTLPGKVGRWNVLLLPSARPLPGIE